MVFCTKINRIETGLPKMWTVIELCELLDGPSTFAQPFIFKTIYFHLIGPSTFNLTRFLSHRTVIVIRDC